MTCVANRRNPSRLALGGTGAPLLRHCYHLDRERAVTTKSSPSTHCAEEICKALEQAVLKYFPPLIETVDTFLFANDADDSAIGDLQSALRPEPPTQTALFEVNNRLSFITHP